MKTWGLLEYRLQWTLTLRGWLVIVSLAIVAFWLFAIRIQPFLACSKPLKADALVVEGWLSDQALKAAMTEFERGHYKLLITTGLPLPKGHFLSQYKNLAQLSADTLIALGFDASQLAVVPAPYVKKYRTAASAVALRQWLATSPVAIESVNLYSYDVHTRRSWLLFKQALEPEIKVGAIALSAEYETPWWTTSDGARAVIAETIAYFYSTLRSEVTPFLNSDATQTKES
ncbi:MAG: ElyC/SanA/YdcF family protein [Cyanophyceae cyanobacterium]